MLTKIFYKINWFKFILLNKFGIKKRYKIKNFSIQINHTHIDYLNINLIILSMICFYLI